MKIQIRQGLIVPRPKNLYLRRSGSDVDLAIDESFIRITFAHGPVNYIVDETSTRLKAWVGPFTSSGSYWFYWDIDTQTAQVTYGYTQLEPEHGPTLPLTPQVDQHFFDVSDGYMKVWDGFNWVQRIRVFAGSLISGTLRQFGNGSQVDINGEFIGDPIRFSKLNSPVVVELQNGNFFFATVSGDPIQDVGQLDNFRMGRLDVSVVAGVNIDKNIAVVYNDDGNVVPASYTFVDREILGITAEAMLAGERKNIITKGFVEDKKNFQFTAPLLYSLFIDGEGRLTTEVPPTSSIQKIGYIAGVNTVYIQPQPQILIFGATPTITPTQSLPPSPTPTPTPT